MKFIKKSSVVNADATSIQNRTIDDTKTDSNTLWTAIKIDNELNLKADASTVYTKTETDNKFTDLIGTAPEALNTLQELAAELANQDSAVLAITNNLANKVDKVEGKQLSTEDYTTTEKTKLSNIATNATKVESSANNGKIKINGTEQTVYEHPLTHSMTEILGLPNALDQKVDKVAGMGLSEADFTIVEKMKLQDIQANANNYSLPKASTTVLGGIKVDGVTITIDANGVISGTPQATNVSGGTF